jgi:hypothetical protein
MLTSASVPPTTGNSPKSIQVAIVPIENPKNLAVIVRNACARAPIGPNSPDWKVGSLVTSSARELLETNRFKQVLEARKNCAPCFAGCTTPYSLLFRGSMKDLTKEA